MNHVLLTVIPSLGERDRVHAPSYDTSDWSKQVLNHRLVRFRRLREAFPSKLHCLADAVEQLLAIYLTGGDERKDPNLECPGRPAEAGTRFAAGQQRLPRVIRTDLATRTSIPLSRANQIGGGRPGPGAPQPAQPHRAHARPPQHQMCNNNPLQPTQKQLSRSCPSCRSRTLTRISPHRLAPFWISVEGRLGVALFKMHIDLITI